MGGDAGSDSYSGQVHSAVNSYRNQIGKKPLKRHGGLDRLAMEHSRRLLSNSGTYSLHGSKVSHEGFDSRVIVARRVLGMDAVSENVAAGIPNNSNVGQYMLTLWKGSPGHMQNLSQDWTYTGIGSVRGGDGTVYVTQMFATPKIGHNQLRSHINEAF